MIDSLEFFKLPQRLHGIKDRFVGKATKVYSLTYTPVFKDVYISEKHILINISKYMVLLSKTLSILQLTTCTYKSFVSMDILNLIKWEVHQMGSVYMSISV